MLGQHYSSQTIRHEKHTLRKSNYTSGQQYLNPNYTSRATYSNERAIIRQGSNTQTQTIRHEIHTLRKEQLYVRTAILKPKLYVMRDILLRKSNYTSGQQYSNSNYAS